MHLTVAVWVPVGILFLPRNFVLTFLFSLSFIFVVSEFLRFRPGKFKAIFLYFASPFLRQKEHKTFTGATFLVLAGAFCALVFTKEIAFLSLMCIIIGDAAASLVGLSFGNIKIWGKTLEGGLACLVVCLILTFTFGVKSGVTPIQGITIAILTPILEMLPVKIDDNIFVPLITGTVAQYLLALIV